MKTKNVPDYTSKKDNTTGMDEQLMQLTSIIFDGDLISKPARDKLVGLTLAQRIPGGFNLITVSGIKYLQDTDQLHPDRISNEHE